jgi:hypothetical protein
MVGVVLLVLAWAGYSMTSGKTKPTSSNPELTQEDQCIWELTLHEWDPRSADELNSIGATSNDSSTRPKPVMGASIDLANEMSLSNRWKDVWSPVDAAKFQVRSATYLSDKVKAPSAPSLFGAIGGDCVVSNGPIRHFANRVELPSTATQLPNYKDDAVVPALFIINIQIPIQPRAMFGAAKLLPTVNAVFYLRLTQDTAENLLKIEEDPEAVRGPVKLLHRWCRDAQTDDVLRGALKLIGFGRNFSELGAPSFVQNYNGKPVLLAGGGLTGNRLGFAQIYRGPNYLEVDIDVASHFTYLSQRGICWALGLCDNLLADVAFVIEGRSEDELPECLLGSVSMSKMPILNALDEAAVFGPSQSVGNPDGGGGDDGSDSNEQTTSRNSGDKNTTD